MVLTIPQLSSLLVRQGTRHYNFRRCQPGDILVGMKAVVIACKDIVEDVEDTERNLQLEAAVTKILTGIKVRLSSSLTNLMTCAKSHATAANSGNSDVVLKNLENAASELNLVVTELIEAVPTEDLFSPSLSAYMDSPESNEEQIFGISDLKVRFDNAVILGKANGLDCECYSIFAYSNAAKRTA